MAMNPKDASILIIDGGQFFSLAQRLAGEFANVYFGRFNDPCYPIPGPHVIGEGFEGITVVDDFFYYLDSVDAVVIPDVGLAGLQAFLKSKGYAVWGAGEGQSLEQGRRVLKGVQKELGLEVPDHTVITGLGKLREFLHGGTITDPCWIKWSKYRGLGETTKFESMWQIEPWLRQMEVKLGPLANGFTFIVEEPIEAEIETGIDTVFAGKWPEIVIHAIEAKDKGAISCISRFEDLPVQLQDICNQLTGWLRERGYKGFLSMEVRITKDGKGYLTDFTARLATPCGEPMLAMIANLPEVILVGAKGEFVEPIYSHEFAAQAYIEMDAEHHSPQEWRQYEIPKSIQDKVYLSCPVKLNDEQFATPPLPYSSCTIGSIVDNGHSIKEAIEGVNKSAGKLPGNLTARIDGIKAALEEIEEMEKEGVPFTDQPVPDPATVTE